MAFIAVSLGASLFVSLVLFEFGARIIESQRSDRPQRRERLDLLTTNPNGTGSYRLKPDIDLVTRIDGREVRIRTNRHGMHWRDVGVGSPSWETRSRLVHGRMATKRVLWARSTRMFHRSAGRY